MLLAEAGQLGTVEGQAVMVAVLVEKMVDVTNSGFPMAWFGVAGCPVTGAAPVSVTGQTVVETTTVSVVT